MQRPVGSLLQAGPVNAFVEIMVRHGTSRRGLNDTLNHLEDAHAFGMPELNN